MKKKKEFILKPDENQKNADWIKTTRQARMEDGKILTGTAEEIIEALRAEVFDPRLLPEDAQLDLEAYMDHIQKEIWRLYGIGIDARGNSTAERAAIMIRELHRIGLLKIQEGSDGAK